MISYRFVVLQLYVTVVFCVFGAQALLNCSSDVLNAFDVNVTSPDSHTVLLSWKNPDLKTFQCSNVSAVISYNNSQGQFVEETNKENFKFSSKPFTTWAIVIKLQTENDTSSEWAFFLNITTAEDAPGEPRFLSTYFDEPNESIFVNWTKPSETNGIIRAYSVRLVHVKWLHSCFVPVPQIAFNVSSEVNSVVFNSTQFKFSSSYEIYVAAITVEQGPELMKVITTPESIPETAPRNLSVSNISCTSFVLSWQPPDCAYSNGWIAFYNVSVKGLPAISGETKATNIHYTELIPNTIYEVTVVALTSVGGGKESVPTTITTLASRPRPSPPRDLTVYSVTNNSLSITWLPSFPPTTFVTNYRIKYGKQNKKTYKYRSVEVQELSCKNSTLRLDQLCYTITSLNDRIHYDIWVTAYDDMGQKSIQNHAYATGRTEESKPEAPSKLELKNHTSISLFVSWLEPVKSNGELIGYRINVTLINLYGLSRIDGHVVYSLVEDNPDITIINIERLEPASTYNVTVEASTRVGYGPPVHRLFNTRNSSPKFTLRLEIGQITKNTVQLLIRRIDNYNGKLRAYFVLVKDVTNKLTYNQLKIEYIAAKLNGRKLTSELINFTVGDGKYYDEFYNVPLQNDFKYTFGIAVLGESNGEMQIGFAYLDKVVYVIEKWPNVVTPSPVITPPHTVTLHMGFIISTILAGISFFVVGFLIIYFKKPKILRCSKTRTIINSKTGDDSQGKNLGIESKNFINETPLYDVCYADSMAEKHIYDSCYTDSVYEMPLYADCLAINSFKTNEIHIKDLGVYVQEVQFSAKTSLEYKSIREGIEHPCKVGKQAKNKSKNRFSALIPYDHSRVKLKKIEGFNDSDYINANYIQNYKGETKFIATQSPKPSTVSDFWSMVWHNNTCKIITLTNLLEAGKTKCEKYWPDCVARYGTITVKLAKTMTFANYVIRTMLVSDVSDDDIEREIKQFHFTTWPDHGIPAYPVSITTFLNQIRNYREDSKSPIVVHGCAGIGRTGTFILLSNMIEMAKDTNKVNLLHGLWSMRQCRVNMVETLEQYIFVYHALLDYLRANMN